MKSELLTPAPWRNTIRRESSQEVAEALRNNGGPGDQRCSEVVVNCEGSPTEKNVIAWMGPAAGSVGGDDLHDAAFIALSRNAFDVMMRRGWWPVPTNDGKWVCRTEDDNDDEDDRVYPDPFTALVEAEKWYVANVDAR